MAERKPKLVVQGNNAMFWGAGGLAGAAALSPIWDFDALTMAAYGTALFIGTAGTVSAAKLFYRDYKVRKINFAAQQTKSEKYKGREASIQELNDLGMLEPVGSCIGRTVEEGVTIFSPHKPKAVFTCFTGGQGTGKTSKHVINNCLHHIINGVMKGEYSLYIGDVKFELLPILKPMMDELKIPYDIINHTGKGGAEYPHTEFQVLEAAIEAYNSCDTHQRKDVMGLLRRAAAICAPEPDEGKTQNPFFGLNGHKACTLFSGDQVVHNDWNASISRIAQIATDPERAKSIVEKWTQPLKPGYQNKVCEELQDYAKALLALIDGDNEDYWPQFLDAMCRKMRAFGKSGHLSNVGVGATGKFSNLRKKARVIFNVSDVKHMKDFATYNALVADAIGIAAVSDPHGLPVKLILDEFQTLNLPTFPEDMLLFRGANYSADFYIQSDTMLNVIYGKDRADVIRESTDLFIWMDIKEEAAKSIIAMAGSKVKRVKNTSFNEKDQEELTHSYADEEDPVYDVPGLMALPKGQAIVKVRGMRPKLVELISYWRLGLDGWFAPPAYYGGTVPDEPDLIQMGVSKNGMVLLHPVSPSDLSRFEERPPSEPPIITPTYFIWAYVWIALLMAVSVAFDLGSPSMLYRSKSITSGPFVAQECRYISLSGTRFKDDRQDCPMFVMR